MANTSGSSSTHVLEGQSITRPPYFDGSNYLYWKMRMKMFLMGNDFEIWRIITKRD